MKDNRPYWLIENPKTNEFYYGVKDLEGHPIFGKNVHKSIAKFIDKENAWEAIINDWDLCELECVPTEHIDVSSNAPFFSTEEGEKVLTETPITIFPQPDYKAKFLRIANAIEKQELINDLIGAHIGKIHGNLSIASVIYFVEKGVVNGDFRSALISMLENHEQIILDSLNEKQSPKRPLSQLADDVETCKEVAELLEFDNYKVNKGGLNTQSFVEISNDKKELIIYDTGEIAYRVNYVLTLTPKNFQIVQLLLSRGYEISK